MIDEFTVKNFKCFQDSSFKLTSFNLVSGHNASGKSSALQGLLLIAQMAKHHPKRSQLPLNGPLIKLGSVGEVLNEMSSSPLIEFAFRSNGKLAKLSLDAEVRTGYGIPIEGLDNFVENEFFSDIEYSLNSCGDEFVGRQSP